MHPDDLLEVELTETQRAILACGLIEWGGPARCTNQIAVGLGFANVRDLFDTGGRIAASLRAGEPLTRRDWLRALLSTELVFSSDSVGSGSDWAATTGFSDEETLRELRAIQARLTGEVRPIVRNGFGD